MAGEDMKSGGHEDLPPKGGTGPMADGDPMADLRSIPS